MRTINNRKDKDLTEEENKKLSVELEKLKASSERKPLLTIGLGLTKSESNMKYPEVFQRNQFITIEEDGTIRLKLKRITKVSCSGLIKINIKQKNIEKCLPTGQPYVRLQE